jgi:Holliday junction resolvasome RuvABC DNA-binding subunit
MQYWLDHDEDAIKANYREVKAEEQQKADMSQFKADDLRALGYTDAEIEAITNGAR